LTRQWNPVAKPRKAYDRANWSKIGEDVVRQMEPWKEIKPRLALDKIVQRLTVATAAPLNRFTPDARPSPYVKRWFTPDLKVQQTKVKSNTAEMAREL
jgi:hypothetical protein